LSADKHTTEATPAVAFSFFLNRLLEREEWARRKLAPFAGDAVELRPPLLPPARLTILEDGRVRPGGEAPALTIVIKPDALAALGRGEEHLLRAVEISGNARLAAEVVHLVRHLRWDVEEDLSRVVGDAAAHRLANTARAFAAWQGDAARRLVESFAAYATDEKDVLVRRAQLEAHAAEVAALRDALERLGQRINRLG
jgi:ubiquinone biosynthesis protein UbiJ